MTFLCKSFLASVIFQGHVRLPGKPFRRLLGGNSGSGVFFRDPVSVYEPPDPYLRVSDDGHSQVAAGAQSAFKQSDSVNDRK